MPGSAVEGTSSAPLLPARATPKRKFEKLADALLKTFRPAVHVLYSLHVASSYLLMLAAMTYNMGVFVAVCVGVVPQ